MRIAKKQTLIPVIVLLVSVSCFTGCLSPKRMDSFVAEQYGNQIPNQDKRKRSEITVSSVFSPASDNLSATIRKTSNVLPLIVYWQWDYRHTCSLNPAIGVANFSNAVNTLSARTLVPKLNGRKLALTVEQIPTDFALVDKAHLIFVIYTINWDKIYVEPDVKDLIVSYKVLQTDNTFKTGRISIKNNAQNKGLRFFQSWKSATSEYLADYNTNITNMTKAFVTKLNEELSL